MNIEAFILIGGRSSRMGRDKAFVEIDGVSLAERTLAKLQAAKLFSRITFVAGHEAQFAIPAIELDAPVIFDIYPGRGPLSGIHAAVCEAKSEWIFVTACDYPFTTPELIALMAGKISGEFAAVVPEQPDGRLQPLFAFYRGDALKNLVKKYVEEQKTAPPMRELMMGINARIVRHNEYSDVAGCGRFFENVNTPEDLKIAAGHPDNLLSIGSKKIS